MSGRERELLLDAFDSNWIAPLGPHVDAFEKEFEAVVGRPSAALSSGTAALHLALILAGVDSGDEVVVPTLTFVATPNAVTYVGATPIFVDSEPATWNLDPDLLAELLANRAKAGRLPAAVIAVDLYGQCADYDRIVPLCEEYEVPLIEDAAESLGATWRGKPAGSFGAMAAFSFNGNKIITTSGGGMLAADDSDLVERARHLSTQAREPAPHYEHAEVGYNYRLSNLLAAVGRGQIETLEAKVQRCREINDRYREAFADIDGFEFMPRDGRGEPTCWLTVARIDADAFGASNQEIWEALSRNNIEARPAWKPMHLQPAFGEVPAIGGAFAQKVFDGGICLPSGPSLTEAEQTRVIVAIGEVPDGFVA